MLQTNWQAPKAVQLTAIVLNTSSSWLETNSWSQLLFWWPKTCLLSAKPLPSADGSKHSIIFFYSVVHAKMPKKIAQCFFGRFQIFAIFLPSYDFCISLWASNGKISAQMINCHWILHCWKNILHFIALKLVKIGQNWIAVSKHRQKLTKNWKSAKKAFCNLFRQLCMYHGVSYLKKIPEPCWLYG